MMNGKWDFKPSDFLIVAIIVLVFILGVLKLIEIITKYL